MVIYNRKRMLVILFSVFSLVHATQDILIGPNQMALPIIDVLANNTQLELYVSFISTTSTSLYVYPAYWGTRCDLIPYYYTNLGPPTIPNAKNLTAWYVSDILNGLICFGIGNNEAVVANVTITATMSAGTQFSAADKGWYYAEPIPKPLSTSSSSSGSQYNAAEKINPAMIFEMILILIVLV